ncbi:MAG: pyrroline-5-carboxylate reductase [Helicobacteraceae bacterium]|nr:pyrroline-5-carboxylate reductase [Helicobacteraceae bacterium]
MKKITIIGYGKMAKAIACGLNNKFELEIIGRNKQKLESFIKDNNLANTIIHATNKINLQDKIVILAIKPYAFDSFKYKNKANTIYSIMAGISIERLKNVLDSEYYCRVMPNIASLVGEGTNIIYTQNLEVEKNASEIFSALGKCIFVEKEQLINSAGAVSGSGTAYLGIVAEAMIDAGVREGLSLDSSKEIVRSLFSGFAKLFEIKEASEIRLDTTSPNGTTAEAICVLENRAIRSAFIDAIHNANKKANSI